MKYYRAFSAQSDQIQLGKKPLSSDDRKFLGSRKSKRSLRRCGTIQKKSLRR
jgi:hypothetical protein